MKICMFVTIFIGLLVLGQKKAIVLGWLMELSLFSMFFLLLA